MLNLRHRISTFANEARSAPEPIAHDESKIVVVELHQISRRIRRNFKAAEETTETTLKLVK